MMILRNQEQKKVVLEQLAWEEALESDETYLYMLKLAENIDLNEKLSILCLK
jgi:hypothetical protein